MVPCLRKLNSIDGAIHGKASENVLMVFISCHLPHLRWLLKCRKTIFVENICKVVVQEYLSPLITQYIAEFF